MRGSDIDAAVVGSRKRPGLARLLGLRVAHFRPARLADGSWRTPVSGDGAGWLDLYIVGPGGVLIRETKGATEAVRPEQQAWIDALTEAGQDAAVWRPADLLSGRVEAELRAIARARP